MPSPLHIVHGVLALDVGGLEHIVLSLIRAGRQEGHRVSVVCVERPGKLAAVAESEGASVISLDKPPGRLSAYVKHASDALAVLKPDVIHTHQIAAAWYLGQAARSSGAPPVLHTEHGNAIARCSTWWGAVKARLLFRFTAKFIDKFCCVSGEIAEALVRWQTVPRAKVEVVPNGIRTDGRLDLPMPAAVRASLGIPEGTPIVGTVGRLTEVKRQDRLVKAVAKLRSTIPEVQLVIVGDGEERANLETLARAVGMMDRAHFVGYQPCPEQYLGIMSVFALTSRSEGFPVSLLEAWLAGVPVVSSAVGGIPGIVTHDVDGILFPPNDVEALVSALSRVLEDQPLRDRLTFAGREVVRQRYSLARMAAHYQTQYRELIAAPRGAG